MIDEAREGGPAHAGLGSDRARSRSSGQAPASRLAMNLQRCAATTARCAALTTSRSSVVSCSRCGARRPSARRASEGANGAMRRAQIDGQGAPRVSGSRSSTATRPNPKAALRGHPARDPARLPRAHALHRGAGIPRARSEARPASARAGSPRCRSGAIEPARGEMVDGLKNIDEGFVPQVFEDNDGQPPAEPTADRAPAASRSSGLRRLHRGGRCSPACSSGRRILAGAVEGRGRDRRGRHRHDRGCDGRVEVTSPPAWWTERPRRRRRAAPRRRSTSDLRSLATQAVRGRSSAGAPSLRRQPTSAGNGQSSAAMAFRRAADGRRGRPSVTRIGRSMSTGGWGDHRRRSTWRGRAGGALRSSSLATSSAHADDCPRHPCRAPSEHLVELGGRWGGSSRVAALGGTPRRRRPSSSVP